MRERPLRPPSVTPFNGVVGPRHGHPFFLRSSQRTPESYHAVINIDPLPISVDGRTSVITCHASARVSGCGVQSTAFPALGGGFLQLSTTVSLHHTHAPLNDCETLCSPRPRHFANTRFRESHGPQLFATIPLGQWANWKQSFVLQFVPSRCLIAQGKQELETIFDVEHLRKGSYFLDTQSDQTSSFAQHDQPYPHGAYCRPPSHAPRRVYLRKSL